MGQVLGHLLGTPGPSGFGSKSTAEDVIENVELHSKTVIITGTTSGIGKETARVFAKKGAHVIMAVHNTKLGEETKHKFLEETPNAIIDVMPLDLSSLASIRKFVEDFNAQNLPLNILINNAGVYARKFELSENGMEKIFATSHIGPFLLTNLLLDKMKITAKETNKEGSIVIVSSYVHFWAPKEGITFDKLNEKTRYAQSKLANILYVKELSRHLQNGSNVTANALHPGAICTKMVNQSMDLFMKCKLPFLFATTCYVATSPLLNNVTGKYFTNCNEDPHISKLAKDPIMASKIWKLGDEFVSTH
ncbi:unnamed protein product [Sphagnum troendelagicum]|uniref:Uncharacterized protein n=1 Tax=Sphagnum troendelagicum TaxID=128251 RepID=A0ABP0TLX2_9BRYO